MATCTSPHLPFSSFTRCPATRTHTHVAPGWRELGGVPLATPLVRARRAPAMLAQQLGPPRPWTAARPGCGASTSGRPSWRAAVWPARLHRHRHRRQRVPPLQAVSAAVASVTHALAGATGLLDMAAVSAAAAASFKLLFLCAVVAWMSHRHMIPPNTSQVMSQVAFSVTIPAMLLVTTAKTLMATAAPASLAGIPAVAVAQVALGTVLGRLAAAAVDGQLPVTRLLGWRPLHPTPSAAAIAASTAAALRAPAAASALLPVSSGVPPALPLLVELGCSFGNTVTLPLLYLATMCAAGDASRAAGFMSLFHAAWSPCLWVFGYSRVQEVARQQRQAGARRPNPGVIARLTAFWRRLVAAACDDGSSSWNGSRTGSGGPSGPISSSGFSPPSTQPAVLITKQLPPSASSLQQPSGWGSSSSSSGGSGSGRAVYAVQSSEDEEASAAPPETTPAERLAARLWRVVLVLLRTELVQKLKKAFNPPVTAVFAGLALGLSPAGAIVSDAAAAAAFVGTHAAANSIVAWELGLVTGILRCCWETVEMLASGTLALQALVLAASLFGGGSSSSQPAAAAAAGVADGSGGGRGSEAAGSGGSSMAQGTVELMSPGGGRSDLDRPLVLGGSSLSLAPPGGGSSSSSSDGGVGIKLRRQSARTADGASASVLQQLLPQSAWEWRSMAAVAAVRFVLLPAASCWLVLGAAHIGLLPADPACTFMLLLQSCMPPAQNLVLMMQLQPGTAGLAPATARLLLQLYTLAVVPVTLWVSVFAKLSGL